jgi:hypothetical protein
LNGRRAGGDPAGEIVEAELQRPQISWQGLGGLPPKLRAERPVGSLEHRRRHVGATSVSDLAGELFSLQQQGLSEPLAVVELRDGGLALGTIPRDVAALGGAILLRLGPELGEPRPGRFHPRRQSRH